MGQITLLENGTKIHSLSKGSEAFTFVFTTGFRSPSAVGNFPQMADSLSKSNRTLIIERLRVGLSLQSKLTLKLE